MRNKGASTVFCYNMYFCNANSLVGNQKEESVSVGIM